MPEATALTSADIAEQRRRRDTVAVIGIGETDYATDYSAARTRKPGEPATVDSYTLAGLAFERALKDSGLRPADIDGLGVITGTDLAGNELKTDPDVLQAQLGLTPTWQQSSSLIWDLLPRALDAIAAGNCSTVALIHGYAQRTERVQYGGTTSPYTRGPRDTWGFTSEGAYFASMFKRHQFLYGSTEEQLAAVPITFRNHAMLNINAIMRQPITLKDYMASRYVCEPLHLYDYCLPADLGACLIIRRTELSKDLPHVPVLISSFVKVDPGGGYAGKKSIDYGAGYNFTLDLNPSYIPPLTEDALSIARVTRKDIQHFQTYDAASILLPLSLESMGFCRLGEGLEFCQDGRIGLGGELPCNTSGGMLSEAYTQGWNHFIELVRQLRHGAGERQVAGVNVSMWNVYFNTSIGVFRRGER